MSDGADRRTQLRGLFDAALRAVSAEACMPSALELAEFRSGGRTCVLAVGKAAAAMAGVAAERLGGKVHGLVVTRRGHGLAHWPWTALQVIEAGHPVPDSQSLHAARQALELARNLGPDDCLLALLSGGGSALLSLPTDGITLGDKQTVTRALLRSGASIAEINCVRKHLSQIKGGRLALAAAPAHVVTLVISDVPGDDPAWVASGPTLADTSSLADAREVLERYAVRPSAAIALALQDPANETPRAADLGSLPQQVQVIASARDALLAAEAFAAAQGWVVSHLGDALQGEASRLGAAQAQQALQLRSAGKGKPQLLLSGGETTVAVRDPQGRGGRNLEYLLGLVVALHDAPGDAAGIWALAADTDGIDGTEDQAGAFVTPDTQQRARALGLNAADHLARNDSYGFFERLGDLIVTGPTRTNVNDLRAVLIEAARC